MWSIAQTLPACLAKNCGSRVLSSTQFPGRLCLPLLKERLNMSTKHFASTRPRVALLGVCLGALLTLPLTATASPEASFEAALAVDDVATVWNGVRTDIQVDVASTFSSATTAGRVALPAPVADPSVVTTIPEPATWGLLLAGVAGVAAVGWLRRRDTQ